MATDVDMPIADCSLVINVARGDVPLLAHTIPHLLTTHKVAFSETLIVVDGGVAEGRIAQRYTQYSLDHLTDTLEQLQGQGYRFRIVNVDYSPYAIGSTFAAWFGNTHVSLKCAGGTPIYAFLFGLDQARCDFRLHLDSDMLVYDPASCSWIDEAIRVLRDVPEVLFVNQAGGPHHPNCPRSEHLATFNPNLGLHVAKDFSTRSFLFSMSKLNRSFLPMRAVKFPLPKRLRYRLQRRSVYMALEQMIAANLARSECWRCELSRLYGFNLHAGDKTRFLELNMTSVVSAISKGDTPMQQCGKYDLDFDAFPLNTW